MIILSLFYVTMSVIDLIETLYGLGTGNFIELNPVMAILVSYPALFVLVKLAGTLFVACLMVHLWNKFDRKGEHILTACVVGLVVIGQTGAVVLNALVLTGRI